MQAMKFLLLVAAGALSGAVADEAEVNPLQKVYELINDLEAKIIKDGEDENKAYDEYASWCRLTAQSVQNDIKTSTALSDKLTAKVEKLSSDIEVGESKIEELSSKVAKANSELSEATKLRKDEKAEFLVAEKELMGAVDTLERALSVLERELSTGGSFAQIDTSNLKTLLQSLSAITDAAGFDAESKEKLLDLVQENNGEDDDELGAPKAAVYESHSGGIMDVLEDMKDKSEKQLADLRKQERNAVHNYELLRQSLEDEHAATNKELADEKAAKAANEEEKANAEGNLEVANKETVASKADLEHLQSECQTVASDHEANVAARSAELKAIHEAEKVLKETTGGAEEGTYSEGGGVSFAQTGAASQASERQRARQLAKNRVINMVKTLAKQHHSAALAQLASRISAVLRYGNRGGEDPFAKVKGLIEQMIAKLEKEAESEATEKAYCDEEMAKTTAKKSELEDTVAKLSAKIEKAASKSASLKEEVAELQSELAALAKEQQEMDKIRKEENAAYVVSKRDLEMGLNGVRKALSVLRDFYQRPQDEAALVQTDSSSGDDDDGDQMSSLMQQAQKQPEPPQKFEKSTGAGSGIVGMLEVIESDFAKNLATEDAEESDAQSSYEKQTQANKITKAQKDQDVKFKTQEFKGLDKTIAELEADRETENTELAAVNEYYAKIKERCIAKPETYEARLARREAEIKGLKEALASLESVAFLEVGQRTGRRTHLRGDSLRTD